MLLPDHEIRRLCLQSKPPLIEPFSESVRGDGKVSWGLTHAGYDLRMGPDVLVFKNSFGEIVDPKRFADEAYRKRVFDEIKLEERDSLIVAAHSYVLVRSLEYLRFPKHLKGRCVGKSTLARLGLVCNTTPIEPGWEGFLTIEISNACPCPVRIYQEGIAQLEVETLFALPEVDYAEKVGKYQGQIGVVPARVE